MQPNIILISVISAVIGFGVAAYIQKSISIKPNNVFQKIFLLVGLCSLGYGLMSLTTEALSWLTMEKQPNVDRITKAIIANIIGIPATMALPYYIVGKIILSPSKNLFNDIKQKQLQFLTLTSVLINIKYVAFALFGISVSAYYYFKVYSNEYSIYDCTNSENNLTPAPFLSSTTGFTITGSSLVLKKKMPFVAGDTLLNGKIDGFDISKDCSISSSGAFSCSLSSDTGGNYDLKESRWDFDGTSSFVEFKSGLYFGQPFVNRIVCKVRKN
jgi:hypothetical protein